jgi:hypothetical protein
MLRVLIYSGARPMMKRVMIGVLLLVSIQVATAVAAPSQVTVLSSNGYLNSLGYYHIVGEVQNTGSPAVASVLVTATCYTSGNTLLGTSSSQTMIGILEPGRKSPFDIALNDLIESARTDHYELAVTYGQSPSLSLGLQVVSSTKKVDSSGYLHISGTIKNNSSAIAHETKVAATFYDSTGKVVDAALSYSDPTDINGGSKASFEIVILEKQRVVLVSSYSLEAESAEYSAIPEFASALLVLPVVVLLALIVMRRRAIPVLT